VTAETLASVSHHAWVVEQSSEATAGLDGFDWKVTEQPGRRAAIMARRSMGT
jgi:hypothetical protein